MPHIIGLTEAGSGSKVFINVDHVLTIQRREFDPVDDLIEWTEITMIDGRGVAVEEDSYRVVEMISSLDPHYV